MARKKIYRLKKDKHVRVEGDTKIEFYRGDEIEPTEAELKHMPDIFTTETFVTAENDPDPEWVSADGRPTIDELKKAISDGKLTTDQAVAAELTYAPDDRRETVLGWADK